MTDIPVVMTSAGAQPTPPATIRATLIANVVQTNPGYTANLPGSLIEDISSTDVGAISEIDAARVDAINSVTPAGANDFVLYQLGQIYIGEPGGAPGTPTNTSVFVTFTAVDGSDNPLPGFVIPQGFTVSDGTYQYIVQDGGVTASSGVSLPLFCIATIAGSWAVPTNSVNQIVTSLPANVILTCANPVAGISGAAAETSEQYRARVFQAGQAISTGTQQLMKTLLGQVPGVQQRLISVRQQTAAWEVICGGGDPYLTAGAILASGVDVAALVGSSLAVTNVTNANPGVVTTALNHGFTTGQTGEITGMIGMSALNGVPFTITVLSEKTFSVGINTGAYAPYVSGGVVTPNLRNETPNIFDAPDTYSVPFVNPPQQTLTMNVNYSTTAPNFTSQAAVAQLAAPAIAAYINSILVGAPISLIVLETTFTAAIASVLDPSLISALTFQVIINGITTTPTGLLVLGDPESFFEATTAGIVVTQT
jgi:hypothetical protein